MGVSQMKARQACAMAAGLLLGMAIASAAVAQKQGGVLRVFHRDSPASMSILEEGSISAIMPKMGVFNNLVLFDQHVPQNRVQSIVPDLATSWTLQRGGDRAHLHVASRRQMARRQAVHRYRRQVHIRFAGRKGEREAAPQLSRGVVSQPRRSDDKWR